jgi:hypothetical protein
MLLGKEPNLKWSKQKRAELIEETSRTKRVASEAKKINEAVS